MKKYIFIVLALISIEGCALDDISELANIDDGSTVWVFTQFNVPEEKDVIESYWYFGEVSQKIYTDISTNKISGGFITLKDAKYWGDDDKVYAYADEESVGDLVFRIEDVRKIELLKDEPEVHSDKKGESENLENNEGSESIVEDSE